MSRARTLACLVAAALLAPGPDADGGEPAGVRAVLEDLPPLVYYREQILVRIRLENAGDSAVECAVDIEVEPPTAVSARPHAAASVGAHDSTSFGFALPAAGWAAARAVLVSGGDRTVVFRIRRFDEGGDLPELAVRGERLAVAHSDESVIVALEQRTSQTDREWFLIKRFAQELGEGTLPAGVCLIGSRLWPDDEEPPYVRIARERAGTWVETTPLPGEATGGAIHPILGDLAAALRAVASSRRAELLVWVIACDDARRGTPARLFRKAVDLVLHRARLRGTSRLSVVFVPEPAVAGERRAAYSEELRASVRTYRGTFVRAADLESPKLWTSPEDRGGRALMRYPNLNGQKALAEVVLSRIRQ